MTDETRERPGSDARDRGAAGGGGVPGRRRRDLADRGDIDDREQRKLGAAIGMWLAVVAVAWLAYSYLHGFDPGLCRHYGGCQWSA